MNGVDKAEEKTGMHNKRTIPIFRCEALIIPVSKLKGSDIQSAHERFTYRFYNDKACKSCENVSDRHNDICDPCQHFKGAKQTSKIIEKEGVDFLSLPAGGGRKVKKWLVSRGYSDRYKVLERTPDSTKFSSPIKFTAKPYPYQSDAADVMLKKKRGILDSPPRSGKTVMATLVMCQIGKKALILGSQLEWLLQFRETFVGSATQSKFTNCKETQIKVCKTLKDFQDTDICLATFSKFMSAGGKALLEKIKDMFGVICADECFTGDHLLNTREGFKTIQELFENNTSVDVLSFNHITQKTEFKPIVSRTKKIVAELVRVKAGGNVFTCTPSHEFWSVNRGCYVKAGDLKPDDELLSSDIEHFS